MFKTFKCITHLLIYLFFLFNSVALLLILIFNIIALRDALELEKLPLSCVMVSDRDIT